MTLLLFFVLSFAPADIHIKNCKDFLSKGESQKALFECRYAIADNPKTKRERRNNRTARHLIEYIIRRQQILEDPNYFKERKHQ